MRPLPVHPEISVVLPNRGDPARLRATLACLSRQEDAPPFEVVLVDDNDDELRPSAVLVGEAADVLPLTVVRGPRQGRAAARNCGGHAARAPWLLFLDSDVLVGSGFLRAYYHSMRPGRYLHGRLRELPSAQRLLTRWGMAAYQVIQDARCDLEPGAAVEQRRDPTSRLMANALERLVEAMTAGSLEDVAPWLGFVGANTAVERTVWSAADGFDEGFGLVWGCEDLEFGYRVHEFGIRRVLVPAALGLHLTHGRPGRWDEHSVNLSRFAERFPVASVQALDLVLSATGTPADYVRSVRAAAEAEVACR